MPCISEYAVLNPNVNFNIIQYTHEVRSSTYDNDYDFIMTSSVEKELPRQTESFWIPQALFTEGSGFLVIAPKHPLYEKLNIQNEYLDFDLIKSENFIGMKKTDILFDKKSSFQQSQRGIFLKSYFQADDFIVRAHALKDGLGIALIPEVCMEDLRLLVPGIKAFKLKNHTVGRTIILMRKKSSLLNESSLDFWDFVLNYYNIPHDEQL